MILGLNGLEGKLSTVEGKTEDPDQLGSQSYEFGGMARLADSIGAVRAQYGSKLLILNAGDALDGSLESHIDQGQTMVRALNQLGVSASTLGAVDLNMDHATLKQRLQESQFPYIVSNLKLKADALPNTRSKQILSAGGLKIGIIGLVGTRTGISAGKDFSDSAEILPLQETSLKEAKALRAQGADVVLLLTHIEPICHLKAGHPSAKDFSSHSLPPRWTIHTVQDPCLKSTELSRLLFSLPKGTVDGVIAGGGSTEPVHHWINGVPVIRGMTEGSSYNLLHLVYDHKNRKVISGESQIDGPIAVCETIFSRQGDCDGRRPKPRGGRGQKVRVRFFGRALGEDTAMRELVSPAIQTSQKQAATVVARTERDLHRSAVKENELGNLVADAMRARLKADVAVINPGAIAESIPSGPVTLGEIYRAIPWDRKLAVLSLNGRQLKRFLRVLTSGARGYASVSGLRLKLVDLKYPAPSNDMDGDHKIEHWEIDRLISVKLPNGEKIRDGKTYTVAATDFLALGGDDLQGVLDGLSDSRIQIDPAASLRNVVEQYLRTIETLPSSQAPLLSESDPRLTLTQPPLGGRSTRGRARRR